MDTVYLYEFIGTAILLLMGNGVVANTVLKDTKSHGAGWVVITIGWGLGGFFGASVVFLFFRQHFNITKDKGTILAVFCTGPRIRNYPSNVFSEVIGTFVLVFTIFHFADPVVFSPSLGEVPVGLGSIGALPVALLVVGIGMSLGGTTGYAINPARDLGPRFAHFLYSMKNKGDSDWSYSWVPVLAPVLGAFIAAMVFLAIA